MPVYSSTPPYRFTSPMAAFGQGVERHLLEREQMRRQQFLDQLQAKQVQDQAAFREAQIENMRRQAELSESAEARARVQQALPFLTRGSEIDPETDIGQLLSEAGVLSDMPVGVQGPPEEGVGYYKGSPAEQRLGDISAAVRQMIARRQGEGDADPGLIDALTLSELSGEFNPVIDRLLPQRKEPLYVMDPTNREITQAVSPEGQPITTPGGGVVNYGYPPRSVAGPQPRVDVGAFIGDDNQPLTAINGQLFEYRGGQPVPYQGKSVRRPSDGMSTGLADAFATSLGENAFWDDADVAKNALESFILADMNLTPDAERAVRYVRDGSFDTALAQLDPSITSRDIPAEDIADLMQDLGQLDPRDRTQFILGLETIEGKLAPHTSIAPTSGGVEDALIDRYDTSATDVRPIDYERIIEENFSAPDELPSLLDMLQGR